MTVPSEAEVPVQSGKILSWNVIVLTLVVTVVVWGSS